MYFLRNLNTVDPINLHANVFILGINKNTTKYAVYGCLQTVISACTSIWRANYHGVRNTYYMGRCINIKTRIDRDM